MKGTFIQKQVVCGLYILYKITKKNLMTFIKKCQSLAIISYKRLKLDLYQNKQLSY